MFGNIGHDIVIAAHLMPVIPGDATEEPGKIEYMGFPQDPILVKKLPGQGNKLRRRLPARPEPDFLFQPISQKYLGKGRNIPFCEDPRRTFDSHKPAEGKGNMLAGAQVIDPKIRARAIIVPRFVPADGDLVSLLGLWIGKDKLREDWMITPILHMEILLLSVLLSEEPLPFLKAKVFGLVGPGDSYPNRFIGSRPAL
jgi:hypothetical protein